MQSPYYLAIDIGASSGRHILGTVKDGKICMEEVHRFSNGLANKDGHLCWDVDHLFAEIKAGMKKCKELGKIPVSVGIDTWAVDFVLLDKDGERVGDTVGYRDSRTEGMDEKVYEIIGNDELYARTGIQKQIFNTVYQLMAIRQQHPAYLEQAETLLMIPDYFHYLLTGRKSVEYTNATTTQLVSPATRNWDEELLAKLGYPRRLFPEISPAGTFLGELTKEMQEEIGYNCRVVLPATHDTGSAVLAVPSNEPHTTYISSGTWSLMGIERMDADCSGESQALNFTNEGGYQYRYRYLKNIMGLWMIQSLKKEFHDEYSFAELCEMAETSGNDSIVDCNDSVFLAPASMKEAIRVFCETTGQEPPKDAADYARIVYRSLAQCYRNTVSEIESRTKETCRQIHVVGGGSDADYLNRLTAEATGRKVLAGPKEATAIGNLMVQMLAAGVWEDLAAARDCVRASFAIKEYMPA